MESCPTQAVLPLVGLAAETVIREGHISVHGTVDRPRGGGACTRLRYCSFPARGCAP
ncbi:MAG: hypothetical protein ACQESR_23230 [Planctomycetota bacterium]